MNFQHLVKFIALVGTGTALFLVGCGSNNKAETPVGYNGKLVDSAVAGVSFSCGGVTGVTDADGVFGVCPAGSQVTFSIGNVVLGTVEQTADFIFTPQDVVGVPRGTTDNTEVNEIAALLLSLDDDGDPTNGVNITPEVVETFNTVVGDANSIDDLDTSDSGIADLITDVNNEGGHTLEAETSDNAAAHLDETNADIEDGLVAPPTQPVDEGTN